MEMRNAEAKQAMTPPTTPATMFRVLSVRDLLWVGVDAGADELFKWEPPS